ncbi:MAG: formylmethanofuran--tetrahydromethanopterin formyltransferase [Candidatus Micrarchaeales archaeon]
MRYLEKASIEKIEDTYAEAFDGLYCRLLVTAERGLNEGDTNSPFIEYDPLRFVAYRATSTPSTVFGGIEAGIEKWLPKEQTPDGREGVVLQYWGMFDRKNPKELTEKFFKEVAKRIRQDILSASGGTSRVFDHMEPAMMVFSIDSEGRIGKLCGGGFETISSGDGEKKINVPLMMGYDFKIDKNIGIGLGISGANFWILCDSVETGRRAGRAAIEAIKKVDGVITPFFICPSGSTAEEGSPTNYRYCPTLKNEIRDSKVPEGVNSIPEIVIDGLDLPSVKSAMREGICAAVGVDGVKMISAGNYKGKLGEHKIRLRELFA